MNTKIKAQQTDLMSIVVDVFSKNEHFSKIKKSDLKDLGSAINDSIYKELKWPIDIFFVEKPPVAMIVKAWAIPSKISIPAETSDRKHVIVRTK